MVYIVTGDGDGGVERSYVALLCSEVVMMDRSIHAVLLLGDHCLEIMVSNKSAVDRYHRDLRGLSGVTLMGQEKQGKGYQEERCFCYKRTKKHSK